METILITGTSRGIGKYLAEYYLSKGFLVIGCSRSSSDIYDNNYIHFEKDLSIVDEINSLVLEIRKKKLQIKYLINNAAINPQIAFAQLLSSEIIEKTLRVNTIAPILLTKEVIKLMMKSKFGRIIYLSTMAVKHEVRGESLYSLSKSAIHTYTRVLAKEIYKMGITANVIGISAIDTDLSRKVDRNELEKVLALNAINKFCKMEDLSNLVDFLISDKSSSITGQIIYIGGV